MQSQIVIWLGDHKLCLKGWFLGGIGRKEMSCPCLLVQEAFKRKMRDVGEKEKWAKPGIKSAIKQVSKWRTLNRRWCNQNERREILLAALFQIGWIWERLERGMIRACSWSERKWPNFRNRETLFWETRQQTKDRADVWVRDLQQLYFSLCQGKPHAMSVLCLHCWHRSEMEQWEEMAKLISVMGNVFLASS